MGVRELGRDSKQKDNGWGFSRMDERWIFRLRKRKWILKPDKLRRNRIGAYLAVQWLRLLVSTAGGVGFIPGRRTKIPHTAWRSQKKKGENIYINQLYFYTLEMDNLKVKIKKKNSIYNSIKKNKILRNKFNKKSVKHTLKAKEHY